MGIDRVAVSVLPYFAGVDDVFCLRLRRGEQSRADKRIRAADCFMSGKIKGDVKSLSRTSAQANGVLGLIGGIRGVTLDTHESRLPTRGQARQSPGFAPNGFGGQIHLRGDALCRGLHPPAATLLMGRRVGDPDGLSAAQGSHMCFRRGTGKLGCNLNRIGPEASSQFAFLCAVLPVAMQRRDATPGALCMRR